MDRLGHQCPAGDAVAAQLVGHDLPGFAAMGFEQAPEETLCGGSIPFGLKIHINYFTILVNCAPQVMLLAIDFDEHFIDIEGVSVAPMFALQSPRVEGTELNAPEPNCFIADGDAALGE